MARVRRTSLPGFTCPRGRRRLLQALSRGLLSLGLGTLAGCTQLAPTAGLDLRPRTIVRGVAADPPGAAKTLPEKVPTRPTAAASAKLGPPVQRADTTTRLPVSLDAVFRLAEEQNPQMALARARVREASAEKAVAGKAWLPAIYVGTAYYRHEGGIQNEDGSLQHSSFGALFGGLEVNARFDPRDVAYQQINAARRVWQQRGDLSRINYETLLDATGTYVDLLTVRTGEALARSTQKHVTDLHERAQALAKTDPAAKVEVARLQAELHGRDQMRARLRGEAGAASAKLVYLLGLDPCTELVPVDTRLVPLDLVDVRPPVCDLVAQALTAGPGIREMEGMLALIHESMEKAKGMGQYLPVVQMRMLQGGFGAGRGSELDWDNRWDLGVQVRWNLTECFTQRERRLVAQARLDQAHWAHQDLRSKLTLGVAEARQAILSGREQVRLAEDQVREAEQAFKLSDQQMRNNVAGVTPSVVQFSLQAMSLAQNSLVQAIRGHNRAQLRLLLLLGEAAPGPSQNGK